MSTPFTRARLVPGVAVAAIVLISAAPAFAAASVHASPAVLNHLPAPPAPGITKHSRRAGPAQSSYIIVDDGSPKNSASQPYGFNDSGQIFGYSSPDRNNNEFCTIWTGSSFVSLKGPGDKSCDPYAISTASGSSQTA